VHIELPTPIEGSLMQTQTLEAEKKLLSYLHWLFAVMLVMPAIVNALCVINALHGHYLRASVSVLFPLFVLYLAIEERRKISPDYDLPKYFALSWLAGMPVGTFAYVMASRI
jgi:hypothetical protein